MRQLPPTPPSAPRTVIVQVPTPAPSAPAPAAATVFPVPQTQQEYRILVAQRTIISSQLDNVRQQRSNLARAYERASGASRAGLEQQLQSIDGRLLQLQADLDASGRALYQSPVSASTSVGFAPPFANINSGQVTAISIVFIAVVLGPLALALGRLAWRRSARPAVPPGWSDAAQRLERLEQAVDTIAVEVERVSEGQRFMTKLMTSQAPGAAANDVASAQVLNGGQPLPALGAGPAEPVVLQNAREEVRVRRS